MKLILCILFSSILLNSYCQELIKIGYVKASDPDNGQTLTYSITAGNTADFFSIDPVNGMLLVKNSVYDTFKRQRTFYLTVKVLDNGKPPMYAKATVKVTLKKNTLGHIITPDNESFQVYTTL